MSLENYTTSGNILPIGLLVCGNCKDKNLRGVDFSNSQIYSESSSSSNGGGVSITTVVPEKKVLAAASAAASGVTISRTSSAAAAAAPVTKEEVISRIRVQPMQRQNSTGE